MYIDEEDLIDDEATILKSHKWRTITKRVIHIHVATVTSIVGIKGAVKIRTFTEHPTDLLEFDFLYTLQPLTMEEKRQKDYIPGSQKKKEIKLLSHALKEECIVAYIEGVTTREGARDLINTEIYVARDALGEVGEDEYFHADLVGLQVKNEKGINIGIVRNVANFGAGDMLEVYDKTSNKSFLHPFSKKFVSAIHLPKGVIRIVMIDSLGEDES